MNKKLWERPLVDWAILALLGIGYCALLLSTVHDLGYARDEGFYFEAADSYRRWYAMLLDAPGNAFKQSSVDRFWRVNHEHPGLIKSLFGLSRALLHDTLGWISEPGTSYRFVGMAMTSGAVGVIYAWGRRLFAASGVAKSRAGAIVAALSFGFMPQIFYHAHLDCFDMPVVAMWLFTSYAYWRSLAAGAWRWSLGAALLYGLMLNTKHNAWLLPFPLLVHWFWFRGSIAWDALRAKRWKAAFAQIPLALWLMASLGPLIFFATWPWIWFDTFDRLAEYVRFHTKHVYYNMEFLGRTYFEPPFPRSYAPVMTLATVPGITLLLFGLGGLRFGFEFWQRNLARWQAWRAKSKPEKADPTLGAESESAHAERSTLALWLLFVFASYAPWLSSSNPIFGGTKHWTTAYPFMALIAGGCFVRILSWAEQCCFAQGSSGDAAPSVTPLVRSGQHLLGPLCAAAVLAAPIGITVHSHPWGLSTYTPMVGGAPGAATLGLNRSFWGYTTGAVQDEINALAPKGAKVFVHDTALQSWQMMAKDGRVRADLKPQLGVAFSKVGIYHHEQHMSRVEHQIWVDYGTVKPEHVGTYDGVPVIWLYKRP